MEGPPADKQVNEKNTEKFLATSDKESITVAKKFLLEKYPGILKNVCYSDFNSARVIFERALEKMVFDTTKEWASFIEAFREIRSDHIDATIKSKNFQKMKDLISKNGLDYIGLEKIALMPKKVVNSTEIQDLMRLSIEVKVSGNYRRNDEDSKTEAIERANEFVNAGIMEPKDAENILRALGIYKK